MFHKVHVMVFQHRQSRHLRADLCQRGSEPVVGPYAVEVLRVAPLHDATTEGMLGDVNRMAVTVLAFKSSHVLAFRPLKNWKNQTKMLRCFVAPQSQNSPLGHVSKWLWQLWTQLAPRPHGRWWSHPMDSWPFPLQAWEETRDLLPTSWRETWRRWKPWDWDDEPIQWWPQKTLYRNFDIIYILQNYLNLL